MKLDSSNKPVFLPQADQRSVLRLGFENCAAEDWLFTPHDLAGFFIHKYTLGATRAASCFAELQDSAAAQDEFQDYLLASLLDNPRLGYRRSGNRLVHEEQELAWDIDDRGLWPASLWIPEDICLLQEIDARYLMTAASVCSPSNWALEDKIGRSIDAIHEPVPAYAEVLGERVNRFLQGLRSGRVMLRYNWSIQRGNELCWRGDENANGQARYWRVERQTFLRLPVTGAIVFGIRIFLHSFASLQGIEGFDRGIAALLAQLPLAEKRYKGLEESESITTS